ncbi:MAG: M50 family metallopeptidase [Pseudomonadota bacterium]
MLITILSFIGVLFVLVMAHELGHFATARAFHVRVEEFGFGFPIPRRLFAIKRGETTYSINPLLLGGFVKMAGEEDPTAPGALASKGIGPRILVLGAGALMNALLPIVLFSRAFMLPHNIALSQVTIQEVKPDSPAALAGIRVGDTVLAVNNREVRNSADLQRYIQMHLGEQTTILVKHADTSTQSVSLVPRWRPPAGQGATGVVINGGTPTIVGERLPFWQAIPMGLGECLDTFILFKNSIILMVIGTAPVAIAGPVGIAQITGEVAKAGIGPLLEFAAFLSINLAIVNIFPLPALDGGRIAFVLLEWVRRGKRISPRVEGLVHTIGFALLLMAIMLVTYQDIFRIISGEGIIR